MAKQIVLNGSVLEGTGRANETLSSKVVVKPVCEAAVSRGDSHRPQKATDAAIRCRQQFGNCMVGRIHRGERNDVGLLEGKALPVLEIRAQDKIL